MNEQEQLEPSESLETLDTQDTPQTPTTTETPPEPPTKADIKAIVQECFADLKAPDEPLPNLLENRDPLAGYDPRFANDIRRLLDQQAQAIHEQYSPLLTANVANIAVEKVAAECTPKTKAYIRDMVAKMDPQTAKAMINDPNGLELLEHIAFGIEAKTREVKIPRTSEPGGFLDEVSDLDSVSLKAFMNAFGVDRKRATELYRQAQRDTR